MNGEKIGIAVKQIISGSILQPSGTVANPESVKAYLILKSKVRVQDGVWQHLVFDFFILSYSQGRWILFIIESVSKILYSLALV